MENNALNILNEKNEPINANLVFEFLIGNKKYVALDYSEKIFNDNSKYNDLSIYEIYRISENNVFATDVEKNDWQKIKDFLNQEIFSEI